MTLSEQIQLDNPQSLNLFYALCIHSYPNTLIYSNTNPKTQNQIDKIKIMLPHKKIKLPNPIQPKTSSDHKTPPRINRRKPKHKNPKTRDETKLKFEQPTGN